MRREVGRGWWQVNYRGSLGFGDDFVRYLLGRVGTTDVQDCFVSFSAPFD